jgi:hypothetical protein
LTAPGKRLRPNWHRKYALKTVQCTIFAALISASLLDFAFLYVMPPYWTVVLDPHGHMPDWAQRLELSSIACLFGIAYIAIRTELHRAAEYRRLAPRPAAHVFRRFRQQETRSLTRMYLAYYLLADALISYLLIQAG